MIIPVLTFRPTVLNRGAKICYSILEKYNSICSYRVGLRSLRCAYLVDAVIESSGWKDGRQAYLTMTQRVSSFPWEPSLVFHDWLS